MGYIEFRQGKGNPGIITNFPSNTVQWSNGSNVRFKPGFVYKDLGKELIATVPEGLPIRNMFTFWGYDDCFRTIVFCDGKVYAYKNNFTNYQDITPVDMEVTTDKVIWDCVLASGYPVLTNGFDPLYIWSDFSNPLTQLSSSAPIAAKRLTKSLHRILAGNLFLRNGTTQKSMVRWANAKNPRDWESNLAGNSSQQPLVNKNTGIDAHESIEAFSHKGDNVFILTKRNVWAMTPATHPHIYTYGIIMPGKGLIAPRVVASDYTDTLYMSFDGFYFIGSMNDISIEIQNKVFSNLNEYSLSKAFAFYSPSANEYRFCYPTGDNLICNETAIYQRDTKAWSFLTCDYNCHALAFDDFGYTADSIPYDTIEEIQESSWEDFRKTGVIPYEIVGNEKGQILKLDSGNNNNGEAISGYIETGDIGNGFINTALDELRLLLKADSNVINPVMIQVGTREGLDYAINWSNPQPYSPGISRKVNFRKQGKWNRIRIYSDTLDSPWELSGYGLQYSELGTR